MTTHGKGRGDSPVLFPAVLVTMWNADALLLAEYGRRVAA